MTREQVKQNSSGVYSIREPIAKLAGLDRRVGELRSAEAAFKLNGHD